MNISFLFFSIPFIYIKIRNIINVFINLKRSETKFRLIEQNVSVVLLLFFLLTIKVKIENVCINMRIHVNIVESKDADTKIHIIIQRTTETIYMYIIQKRKEKLKAKKKIRNKN